MFVITMGLHGWELSGLVHLIWVMVFWDILGFFFFSLFLFLLLAYGLYREIRMILLFLFPVSCLAFCDFHGHVYVIFLRYTHVR